MLFDCSSELVKKFQWGWEMMPIMYALSKYANGNIDEILRRIEDGELSHSFYYYHQHFSHFHPSSLFLQHNSPSTSTFGSRRSTCTLPVQITRIIKICRQSHSLRRASAVKVVSRKTANFCVHTQNNSLPLSLHRCLNYTDFFKFIHNWKEKKKENTDGFTLSPDKTKRITATTSTVQPTRTEKKKNLIIGDKTSPYYKLSRWSDWRQRQVYESYFLPFYSDLFKRRSYRSGVVCCCRVTKKGWGSATRARTPKMQVKKNTTFLRRCNRRRRCNNLHTKN